jgi:16S rRNA (cytosine967-C5)-methyltransferase
MSNARSGAWLRAEAANVVEAVVSDGRSLDAALAVAEENIGPRDRPMLRMLAYGTLRHHFRLREQLRVLLDRPLKKRDKVIESLLAIGFFQLTDTRVPDHAAVSMTVEAARLLRRPKYAGLINAVLRNFTRKNIAASEPTSDESRFNHPQWLIDRLRNDWPDDWQSIIAANNDRAPMWLRVNAAKTDAQDYLELLAAVVPGDSPPGELQEGIPQAIRLASPMPVEDLPGFADGLVSIQDAAAQLAGPWLLAGGGNRVLDACAAPGGKTCHLLELLGPGADVTAIDVEPGRLARVNDNLERQGFVATVVAADASDPGSWWDGKPYDRILLDAPCSATGVIRRHPDIKLLRREDDIAALAGLQRKMLEALWQLLAPGGRLLYVTCSVLAAENEAVVADFLASSDDATEDKVLHDYNIRALMCERSAGFQVLPGTGGLDGFYFAALDKKAPTQG